MIESNNALIELVHRYAEVRESLTGLMEQASCLPRTKRALEVALQMATAEIRGELINIQGAATLYIGGRSRNFGMPIEIFWLSRRIQEALQGKRGPIRIEIAVNGNTWSLDVRPGSVLFDLIKDLHSSNL